MNAPKCEAEAYIQFLIATPRNCTCTEAAEYGRSAHDAFNRLQARAARDTESLWQEAGQLVRKDRGVLVLDDSTLDKPYAQETELVYWHWSGKHHQPVQGVNLLTLLWTDGTRLIPSDFRLYDKTRDGKSKNDHFQDMLEVARQRGFQPEYVLFDSWYGASTKNLKTIDGFGWRFLSRLKANRQVNPERSGNRPVCQLTDVPQEGRLVHLKGYGFVRLFRAWNKQSQEVEYWCTNHLEMSAAKQEVLAEKSWGIEVYHRGLKQCCLVERFQCRKADKITGHILLAIRAFLRLEYHRIQTMTSWYESKTALIREAIKAYLSQPTLLLPSTA